jgi:hypothetical protein
MVLKMRSRLPWMICFFILLCGCATPQHHRSHGAKLSKAMEKASNAHTGDRTIHTRRPGPSGHEHGYLHPPLVGPGPVVTVESAAEDKKDYPFVAGFNAGYTIAKGEDTYQLYQFDLTIGSYLSDKQRLEAYIGAGWPQIDDTEALHNSIDNVWIFSYGLRHRIYTTPRNAPLGHYFVVGAGISQMYWQYKHPIYLNGRRITGDNVTGCEFNAGMGIQLSSTRHYQIGLELLPSAIFWYGETYEGFDNDVFDPFYMVKLRLTLSFF